MYIDKDMSPCLNARGLFSAEIKNVRDDLAHIRVRVPEGVQISPALFRAPI